MRRWWTSSGGTKLRCSTTWIDHFTPLYDFDYGELAPILNRVRIKGNRLYETQKHVVASTYTALQQRKGVIVVGEPGVGKTVVGASLAIALRPHMKPDQVVIIMAPPHLTGKMAA